MYIIYMYICTQHSGNLGHFEKIKSTNDRDRGRRKEIKKRQKNRQTDRQAGSKEGKRERERETETETERIKEEVKDTETLLTKLKKKISQN